VIRNTSGCSGHNHQDGNQEDLSEFWRANECLDDQIARITTLDKRIFPERTRMPANVGLIPLPIAA
jgi:hypothetical protein